MNESPSVTQVPRNAEQRNDLVLQQPFAWEYRLFAGVLLERRESLELKWRDHSLRFAPGRRRHMDDVEAVRYLDRSWDSAGSLARGVETLLAPRATELAFGSPGATWGDPVLIEHLAHRIVGIYEDLIDWGSDLRTFAVSDDLVELFELAARSSEQPVRDIRKFIDRVVSEMEELPAKMAAEGDDPIVIEVTLKLTADEKLVQEYLKKSRKVKRKLKI